MSVTFKWKLGVGTGIHLEITAERFGVDGVIFSNIEIKQGGVDLTHIGQLLKMESPMIEEHAHEAMLEIEREVEQFMTAEERDCG